MNRRHLLKLLFGFVIAPTVPAPTWMPSISPIQARFFNHVEGRYVYGQWTKRLRARIQEGIRHNERDYAEIMRRVDQAYDSAKCQS